MIRVHIKRKVSDDKKEELLGLLNRLRSATMGLPGYISGETLKRVDQRGEMLVVTKWQSIYYWNEWFQGAQRSAIQDKIDQLLGVKTVYEIYEYE